MRRHAWHDPDEALQVAREWGLHWPTINLLAKPQVLTPLNMLALPIVCDCMGTVVKGSLDLCKARTGSKWSVEAGASVFRGTYAALAAWKRGFFNALCRRWVVPIGPVQNTARIRPNLH